MEKEGGFKSLMKWLAMGRYTLFNIPIRKKIVEYNMGGKDYK
jgi:hypothetical protein